ncbi:MAG TPA: hypothetical protein VK157_08490 [Phycisphaerales bacterium]|nr:hypothetical protein [Phycisphaerales bacterium]
MRHHVTALSLLTCVTSPVAAQLFDFTDGVPAAGVVGQVYAATLWDPDGPGPGPTVCVVAGSFKIAGDKFSSGLALWDFQAERWTALDAPLPPAPYDIDSVFSVFVTHSNELLVGNSWDVYRWTGSQWHRFGPDTSTLAAVTEIAQDAEGSIYISGGPILSTFPVPGRFFERWNGSTWITQTPSRLSEMRLTPDGTFWAAGGGSSLYRNTANGWQGLSGQTGAPSQIWEFINQGNDLIAATGAAQSAVQRYNGATWTRLVGLGDQSFVGALTYDAQGNLFVGGTISSFVPVAPPGGQRPSLWGLIRVSPDGSASDITFPLPPTPSTVPTRSVTSLVNLPNGGVFVGGTRLQAVYDGAFLRPLAGGSNGSFGTLTRLPNNDLLATGQFNSFSNGDSAGVVLRTSTGWISPTGQTLRILNEGIAGPIVSTLPDGTIYARAFFVDEQRTRIGPLVAKYTDGDWVPVAGPNGPLRSLPYNLADGSLLAIDSTLGALRFDGTTWQSFAQGLLGASTSVPPVNAPDGHTYIVQRVASGEYQLFRRNTDAWAPVGPFLPLASDPRELLFAGSLPTLHHANSVFQLVNDTWHNLTSNARIIGAVTSDSSGTLYAGGQFNFPASAEQDPGTFTARWNGHRWLRVSPSLFRSASQFQPTIDDLLIAPDGSIEVAGTFTNTANMVAMGYVRAVPSTRCDSIDFNNNGVFPEDQDVIDFLRVLAGDPCETCNDLDFNNDTVFVSDDDVMAFFTTLSGAPCP